MVVVAAEPVHLAFASALVLLVVHLDIVLWVAPELVLAEEGRVSALEDVDVGEVKCGITMLVDESVMLAQMQSPGRRLAMHAIRGERRDLTCVGHDEPSIRSGR